MRVFIAVKLEESFKNRFENIKENIEVECEEGSFTTADNLHLTLKFIGEVGEEKLEEIKSVVDEAANDFVSFKVKTEKVNFFRKKNKKIVWVGTDDETGELVSLANCVDDMLERIGIEPEEREFVSHITVGRNVKTEKCEKEINEKIKLEPIELTVNNITIMESKRIEDELKYVPIYTKYLNEK